MRWKIELKIYFRNDLLEVSFSKSVLKRTCVICLETSIIVSCHDWHL